MTVRVGGSVQAANLVRKVTPAYPTAASEQHIAGTARLTALIGLDGQILKLNVNSGPPELIRPSVDAAQQWLYKPTLFNGKPCYVITSIDINYEVRPQ
jgi:outer membrane biosynthesis protein TonB